MREIRLYFIAAPGRIKIGVSVDLKRRMDEIGKHLVEPIELIGHVAGSYAFEKHLHLLLAEHSLGREWFRDCDQVRGVMARVLAGDVIGFKPKDIPSRPKLDDELTFERWLARFNAFAGMIFPDETTRHLAEFLEVSPDQAQRYLLGQDDLPDLLWSAFSARVVAWVLEKHRHQRSALKTSA